MARLTLLILAFSICFSSVLAQTTSVTYQGKLTDGSNPANGQYDFVFRLFDSSGTQIGGDLEKGDVQVTGGVFTVSLNFGLSPFAAGAADSLEIGVRPGLSTGLYTTLTPRQPLASSPFTIRSLSSVSADSASDSAKLGGVAANQYVVTTDPRLTDARTPTAGSDNYVQNRTTPQGGNFNLSGDGVVGGSLGVGGLSPGNKLNVTGNGIVRARINSDSNGGLSFALSDQPKWSIATVTGGDLQVFNDATGQLAMSVNGSTNVISGNGSGLTEVKAQTTANLSALSLLRWDLLSKRTFTVGFLPVGLTFDGANIWVANSGFGANTVTKLRASDGANLGTFAVGSNPQFLAFDGTNIWVANFGSNNLTKLRASDGANLGSFTVGSNPNDVAFDGTNIWAANNTSNNLTKLRASDGAIFGTFAVGSGPRGIAFDGTNIWVTNSNDNSVTKLRASDGNSLGTFPAGTFPIGITFDGANIWIAGQASLTRLRASDGACVGTCTFAVGASSIVFDGTNLWATTASGLTKVSLTGTVLGAVDAGAGILDIAFDGQSVWVTNFNNNTVTRIPAFP